MRLTKYSGGATKKEFTHSFLVEVRYQSYAGNPLALRDTVRAYDCEHALEILEERAKKKKNFMRLQGGTAELIPRTKSSTP